VQTQRTVTAAAPAQPTDQPQQQQTGPPPAVSDADHSVHVIVCISADCL